MKEKTFNELIINIIDDEGNIRASDVHELLHQVREATIAECRESIRKEYKTFKGHYQLPLSEQLYNLNKLPTDRIKLTENK